MPSLARLLGAAGLAFGFWAVAAYGSPPRPAPARALAAAHGAAFEPGPELVSFYAERDFQPVWTDGADQALLDLLPPRPDVVAALNAVRRGDRRGRLLADMMLSQAFLDAARDSARPPQRNAMRYIDAGLAPAAPAADNMLYALAAAPSPVDFARTALARNPAYDGLVRGLAAWRARWSRLPQAPVAANRPDQLRARLGLPANADPAPALRAFQQVHGLAVTGRADPATIAALNRGAAYYERLILANIERARAIPAVQGRYVLVDTASARLWMVEDGRIRDSMRVIVGKRAMPTPEMAGLIRYAALNPYWNLPPDLIRKRARNAVAHGPGVITGERLQVLSDWSDRARPLDPRRVNWSRGRRRSPACEPPPAARAAEHDGSGQVHAAQRSRRLSARHTRTASCSPAATGGKARAASGSRTRSGSAAGCSTAPCRGGERHARAAGRPAGTGPGLHHLSDRAADRRRRRLPARFLSPRSGDT